MNLLAYLQNFKKKKYGEDEAIRFLQIKVEQWPGHLRVAQWKRGELCVIRLWF